MGSVFQSRDVESGQLVAVKVMRGLDEVLARRLVQEGRALADLHHPNIVRYVSHGLDAGGEPYLVVEWLAGEDLGQRLQRGRLGLGETLGIVRAVADALGAAHRRGIVHRDVKPSNIFLVAEPEQTAPTANLTDASPTPASQVKVLDFGIALLLGGDAPLRGATILGTPGYLAPEQARGDRTVDARADVFALDFWGSWCAPCVHAFPTLRRLHADFGDRLTVVGLAFYSGELADIERFAAEHELDYTVLEGHDDALEEFEIFVFPSYVLISAAGEVLFVQAGEADDLYARVAAALGEG
jgi:serine/threonine protein kinase